MQSALFTGSLFHRRLSPVEHVFSYPAFFCGFRLAELDELARSVRGFSHDRFNLLALHDRDYLDRAPGTLEEKLARHTRAAGITPDPARTVLFTSARYFHYAFNPVSFYFGLNPDDTPAWALAEVNNTFQDRHLYLLPSLHRDGDAWVAAAGKTFHVSPFNDLRGEYRFRFLLEPARVRFDVDLWKDGQPFLLANLSGRPSPFTSANLARTLLRFPAAASLTFPRIVAQAARLKFQRKLAWFSRPVPAHPDTIRRREDGMK